jgi:RND family efflux transporter MFP subunit
MSKNKVFYSILFFAEAIYLWGCNAKPNATPRPLQVDTLKAFIATKQSVSKVLTLPAELIPFERSELFAKIPGYIKEMKADIGDKVKKEQVLAVVEAAEYNANLLQSVSSAESAKAKYQSSNDYYERLINAAKEPGAIAEGELIKARNQMLADSAAYKAAKQASEAYSQINNYLIIKSPFNGVVTQRNADAGNLAGTNGTKALLVVENNNILRLRVPVPETYTAGAADKKEISFTTDAIPDKMFTAVLSRKSGSIDLSNRTELWEYLVKNDSSQLRSGMYVSVKLPVSRQQPSVVVPYAAVATTLEKKFVIRFHNGLTQWIDVRPGMNLDSTLEIFGNIGAGDTLLMKATDEIKPNTHVAVKLNRVK